jgi:putative IMPACT (imprinted ancient) family translation regulator
VDDRQGYLPYQLFERVKNEIDTYEGFFDNADYGADVTVTAVFPADSAQDFLKRLSDLSAGTIAGEIIGEDYRAIEVC